MKKSLTHFLLGKRYTKVCSSSHFLQPDLLKSLSEVLTEDLVTEENLDITFNLFITLEPPQ